MPWSSTSVVLCASHVITKFGSKGWEFATPLLLLHFSPDGGLIAPTLFGLVVFVLKFLFGPMVGLWMDQTQRLRVIRTGVALQTAGVFAALAVYALLCSLQSSGGLAPSLLWALIGLMIVCGVIEALGALISSVAVKRDWVPTIWTAEDPELSSINAAMSNIDLGAEILGPLTAGAALQLLGDELGFVVIGAANIASFGVEFLLLLRVYKAQASLSAPKPPPKEDGKKGGLLAAWPIFVAQPSGIPLLVLSYSLLYFTVLSPHGVVLTAYLQTRQLSPPALAAFRAAGALSGVAGMAAFSALAPRVGLRPLASAHLWLLASAVAAAAASFYATQGSEGLTWPMLLFLALVTVSRYGLYAFDLANLQLQQIYVDETLRGSVGAVESSLCSLGTASVFVGTLWSSAQPEPLLAFDGLVYASAAFVGSAALVYSLWLLLYHEHEHAHPLFDDAAAGSHRHTTQQLRSLEESPTRTHSHLHLHVPCGLGHDQEHAHGHDHN